jgi:hypothetical protein
MAWRTATSALTLFDGRSVSSIRVTVGSAPFAPGRLPPGLSQAAFGPERYDIALVRDWPRALNVGAGAFQFDLSPHAGVGLGSAGTSVEAGATLRLGKRIDDQVVARLADMGVRDGAAFGDRGRWYLFAAASGRAVGLNMMHGDGGWSRQGWSTDPAATIADAQLGVGWRKGTMQTSLGYLRREVKSDHKVWGQETRADSLIALSFSLRPR